LTPAQRCRRTTPHRLTFRDAALYQIKGGGAWSFVRRTGRTVRSWKRRLAGERPLLKDPIAFFSAEWLARTYGADVVVLIRHPAGFAGSLKRMGSSFDFNDFLGQPDLLRASLTHASGANTRLASNERMEFLGDSVLGLVTCEQLYLRFPDYQEGDLTKIKSVVVSRRTCARFSKALNLGAFLFLGKGMNHLHSSAVPPSMLADVYESLVAAVYLDGGLEAARAFILRHLGPEIEEVAEGAHGGNFKSLLQQVAQREFNAPPQYHLLDEKGPDHSKFFVVCVAIGGQRFTSAWAPNK